MRSQKNGDPGSGGNGGTNSNQNQGINNGGPANLGPNSSNQIGDMAMYGAGLNLDGNYDLGAVGGQDSVPGIPCGVLERGVPELTRARKRKVKLGTRDTIPCDPKFGGSGLPTGLGTSTYCMSPCCLNSHLPVAPRNPVAEKRRCLTCETLALLNSTPRSF